MRTLTPFLVVLLLSGCADPATSPATTSLATPHAFICRGTPNQGSTGSVEVLGVETSPLAVAHETIEARMEVAYPGWLNLTADWEVRGEGEVDLLVQRPGLDDEVVTQPPYDLRLLDPPLGNYTITLRAHPVAYDVHYAVHVRYNYTFEHDSADCPGTL